MQAAMMFPVTEVSNNTMCFLWPVDHVKSHACITQSSHCLMRWIPIYQVESNCRETKKFSLDHMPSKWQRKGMNSDLSEVIALEACPWMGLTSGLKSLLLNPVCGWD